MSAIPPEIARFRQKGTEIKCIRGHYYLQRVTSKWDKQARKVRKITLGYLGRVTPEGVIPRKTRRVPADAKPYSKEFGATWALRQLTPDILQALEKHFPEDAHWLYATALIRCIRHCAMRYTEHFYDVSYLSEAMPGLRLASPNLSNLMTSLGYRRRQMVEFMRSFIPSRDCFLIFDGTSVVCNSQNIAEAQRGYNSHGCHDPQVNLLYAVALREHRLMPVFYKRYPGSIRDVSAFANLRKEMGVGEVVAICDKGFAKKSDQEEMEASGIAYLTPLKRNNRECPRTPLGQPGFTGFQGRFLYNGRIVWYWEAPAVADAKHRCILYLDESLRHQEQSSLHGADIGNETPEQIRKVAEAQLLSGTICLKTSLAGHDAQTVYRTYKLREEIEQLFDTYKAEEDFNTTGMHTAETQEAAFFLNHLSVMMAYRVYEQLKENKGLKTFAAVKTPETYLWDVRATNPGDGWQLEPIPKAAKKAFNALGLTPPDKIS